MYLIIMAKRISDKHDICTGCSVPHAGNIHVRLEFSVNAHDNVGIIKISDENNREREAFVQ